MAKIRKRGNSYQIDYFDPNGKRFRKSFSKKKDAEAELDKRVSLIAEHPDRYLEKKKQYSTTFGELLDKYEENFKNQASFKKYKKFCIENFKNHFGENTLLSKIKYMDLEIYRNHLRQKLTQHRTIRTDASINREMACLHHIFTKASEWEMIEKSPFNRGKSLLLKENNKRIRYLTDDELSRFIPEAKRIPHYYQIAMCALHTGMRKGEILNLKWNQIRNGFIYLEKTKTNERREIPISEDLSKDLDRIKKEQRAVSEKENVKPLRLVKKLTSDYVFTYAKRNIKRIDRAHKKVCENAGIEDFRFHDLRHTFASHVLMRGGSLKDVQELLGHKTMTMTLRYAHSSQEHKKKAVNLLNGLTSPTKSDMSQNVTFSVIQRKPAV